MKFLIKSLLLLLFVSPSYATCSELDGQTNCDNTLTVGAKMGVGTISPSAQIHVIVSSMNTIGEIIKAASGQTADLQEWQDSNGLTLASMTANGTLYVVSFNAASLSTNLLNVNNPVTSFAPVNIGVNSNGDGLMLSAYSGFGNGTITIMDSTGLTNTRIEGGNNHFYGDYFEAVHLNTPTGNYKGIFSSSTTGVFFIGYNAPVGLQPYQLPSTITLNALSNSSGHAFRTIGYNASNPNSDWTFANSAGTDLGYIEGGRDSNGNYITLRLANGPTVKGIWVSSNSVDLYGNGTKMVSVSNSGMLFVADGSTQTTAYTASGHIVKTWISSTTAATSGTVTVPEDDTIPQITEGVEFLSSTFTALSATDNLEIYATLPLSESAAGTTACSLYRTGSANALGTVFARVAAGVAIPPMDPHWVIASTSGSQNITVRCGNSGVGTIQLNSSNASGRQYGGASVATLIIHEVVP